jgi:CheY-like chemotaxis protein
MFHLLVIDDEQSIGHMITMIAHADGITVTHTTEGQRGIELARREQPDLILVDLFLWGKMDGWETIELIKKDESLRHIPVVAMTAVGDLDHAYEMGCDDAFLKPFTPAMIRSHIARFTEAASVA